VPTSQFVSPQVGNATIFPPGGLARLVVEGNLLDTNLTAAVFEDSACAASISARRSRTIAKKCAGASLVVQSCPGAPYQVVHAGRFDHLGPPTARSRFRAATFCPTQRGHYIYGLGTDEEPDLSPTCDYVNEATQYYAKIDPSNAKDTLAKFKTANDYNVANEINAIYYNNGDHRRRTRHALLEDPPERSSPTGDAAACYVTNYGASFVDPPVSVDDALAQVIERDPNKIAATVAMEYLVADVPDPVRFFAYGPGANGTRIKAIKLDTEGPKPIPGELHHVSRRQVRRRPAHRGRNAQRTWRWIPAEGFVPAVRIRARSRTRPSIPTPRADQEEKFRLLNSLVRDTRPEKRDGPGITSMIFGMYGHDGGGIDTPGQTANSNWVPVEWESAGLSNLYRDVVKPFCRTCHAARTTLGNPDDPANNPSFNLISLAPTLHLRKSGKPTPGITAFHAARRGDDEALLEELGARGARQRIQRRVDPVGGGRHEPTRRRVHLQSLNARSLSRFGAVAALAALVWTAAPARAAACARDVDCPGTECGSQVCDWVTGTPTCVPAGSKWPQGADGECATDADCKCAPQGARCFAPFCTFTVPPDAGAGGTTGTAGASGAGGSAAGGAAGSGRGGSSGATGGSSGATGGPSGAAGKSGGGGCVIAGAPVDGLATVCCSSSAPGSLAKLRAGAAESRFRPRPVPRRLVPRRSDIDRFTRRAAPRRRLVAYAASRALTRLPIAASMGGSPSASTAEIIATVEMPASRPPGASCSSRDDANAPVADEMCCAVDCSDM
jgi:hypothetical protein